MDKYIVLVGKNLPGLNMAAIGKFNERPLALAEAKKLAARGYPVGVYELSDVFETAVDRTYTKEETISEEEPTSE